MSSITSDEVQQQIINFQLSEKKREEKDYCYTKKQFEKHLDKMYDELLRKIRCGRMVIVKQIDKNTPTGKSYTTVNVYDAYPLRFWLRPPKLERVYRVMQISDPSQYALDYYREQKNDNVIKSLHVEDVINSSEGVIVITGYRAEFVIDAQN